MKMMIKWEKGDRVRKGDGRVGTVGLMAKPYRAHILPDGAPSWVLRWWVRWDTDPWGRSEPWMTKEWGSDLSPEIEEESGA